LAIGKLGLLEKWSSWVYWDLLKVVGLVAMPYLEFIWESGVHRLIWIVKGSVVCGIALFGDYLRSGSCRN
jgi:hypothetical protein